MEFCSQIMHTFYNKGSLSQPDAFRTCLDFWFGNQLTGKARHSSQEQLNLLTWNKKEKPPAKRIHFGMFLSSVNSIKKPGQMSDCIILVVSANNKPCAKY